MNICRTPPHPRRLSPWPRRRLRAAVRCSSHVVTRSSRLPEGRVFQQTGSALDGELFGQAVRRPPWGASMQDGSRGRQLSMDFRNDIGTSSQGRPDRRRAARRRPSPSAVDFAPAALVVQQEPADWWTATVDALAHNARAHLKECAAISRHHLSAISGMARLLDAQNSSCARLVLRELTAAAMAQSGVELEARAPAEMTNCTQQRRDATT